MDTKKKLEIIENAKSQQESIGKIEDATKELNSCYIQKVEISVDIAYKGYGNEEKRISNIIVDKDTLLRFLEHEATVYEELIADSLGQLIPNQPTPVEKTETTVKGGLPDGF